MQEKIRILAANEREFSRRRGMRMPTNGMTISTGSAELCGGYSFLNQRLPGGAR
jgi:hypothetical protein